MSKKKVLIIGGAGYIGGRLADAIKKSFIVHVYDNLLYESRYLKSVKFIYGDIRNTNYIADLCKKEKYDIIILLAAIVGDPACDVNPELTREINYTSIKNLCKKIDKDIHFVFASSCSVYGFNNDIVNENSATDIKSLYAKTKLLSEKYILDRDGTVFRFGTVYGLGDTYARIRADLVVNILSMKAANKEKITIFNGNQWRPIVSVKNICGYIKEVCEDNVCGVFNLCEENVQISSIADRIKKLIPGTISEILPYDPTININYRVSMDLANSIFKFKAYPRLDKEILLMYNLIKEKRVKNLYDINYHNGNYLNSVGSF